jgi:hypothetical protein
MGMWPKRASVEPVGRRTTQEGEQMAAIKVEDIEETVESAYHKASIVQGLLRSQKGRHKTATIEGLLRSLLDDVDDVACILLDARYQERQNAN